MIHDLPNNLKIFARKIDLNDLETWRACIIVDTYGRRNYDFENWDLK